MATRTISDAGGNYNNVATWVEGAVPTSADDVVATATSGNLTVNVSSAALTVDFTNYTGTLTMNAAWTISGSVFKLVAGMTVSGNGTLTFAPANGSTITLTSAGNTWSGAISFANVATYTINLADDWIVNGQISSSQNGIKTINNNTLFIKGNMNFANVNLFGGTTLFEINGTGNQSIATNSYIASSVRINKASGTLTIANLGFIGSNFDYIQGTVAVTSGTTFALALGANGTQNLNCTNAISWANVAFGSNTGGGARTVNFTSDFIITGGWSNFTLGTLVLNGCSYVSAIPGTMTIPPTTGTITYTLDNPLTVGHLTTSGTNGFVLNGSTIHVNGNLTIVPNISGTGTIQMDGTNKSITSTSGTTVSCNFTINSTTITLNSGSTLRYSTRTLNLNHDLLGTGVVAITNSCTINGGGNAINYFRIITAGVTVTLSSALSIKNEFLSLAGTLSSRVLIKSNSGGTQRKFTLFQGATQSVLYCNATDIDSNDGQTIWSFGSPSLSNTLNWRELTAGSMQNAFIY